MFSNFGSSFIQNFSESGSKHWQHCVLRAKPCQAGLFSFMFVWRIIEMDTKVGRIEITNPADKTTKAYTFDTVYDWKLVPQSGRWYRMFCWGVSFSSKQQDLYDETFRALVNSVLEGFNGTIFAYGQTGPIRTISVIAKFPRLYGSIFRHWKDFYNGRSSF